MNTMTISKKTALEIGFSGEEIKEAEEGDGILRSKTLSSSKFSEYKLMKK